MFNLTQKSTSLLIDLIKTELEIDVQKELYEKYYKIGLSLKKDGNKKIDWKKFFEVVLQEWQYDEFLDSLVSFLYKYDKDEACEKINDILFHSGCKYRIYYAGKKRISKTGSFCEVFIINEQDVFWVIKKLENSSPIAQATFEREWRVINRLKKTQETISEKMILDIDVEGGFIVKMEKADYSLYEAIDKKYVITNSELLDMLKKVKFLHDEGIIHRDLHPGNFLNLNLSWYIIDFGVSSIETSHTMITFEEQVGVKEFTDPKVFNCLNNATKQTDIYSVGKIINYIKTGDPNCYEHKLAFISRKCTLSDLEQRYKNISEVMYDVSNII